jgi:hypothetical protein
VTAWTGRAQAGTTLITSIVVVLVLSIVIAVVGGAPLMGVAMAAVVCLVLIAFVSIDVTVDERGLTVASGALPFVRVRFPLERITSAEAIDVNPWRWGGWGYRGSVRIFRRAAWVLRRGPGIKVNLARGRVFVVTVDDAEAGAAALQRRLA